MGIFGSKEIIGLDIGSSSIKLAHLKMVGGECRLRKFGAVPLPSDAIVDGHGPNCASGYTTALTH